MFLTVCILEYDFLMVELFIVIVVLRKIKYFLIGVQKF